MLKPTSFASFDPNLPVVEAFGEDLWSVLERQHGGSRVHVVNRVRAPVSTVGIARSRCRAINPRRKHPGSGGRRVVDPVGRRPHRVVGHVVRTGRHRLMGQISAVVVDRRRRPAEVVPVHIRMARVLLVVQMVQMALCVTRR